MEASGDEITGSPGVSGDGLEIPEWFRPSDPNRDKHWSKKLPEQRRIMINDHNKHAD